MSSNYLDNQKNLSVGLGDVYPVIVKGFMGEPVRMNAVDIKNNRITVVKIDGITPISLKRTIVYQDDEMLYRNLTEAFGSKDDKGLKKGWQKAIPIETT